jgi:hypothetical protein
VAFGIEQLARGFRAKPPKVEHLFITAVGHPTKVNNGNRFGELFDREAMHLILLIVNVLRRAGGDQRVDQIGIADEGQYKDQ